VVIIIQIHRTSGVALTAVKIGRAATLTWRSVAAFSGIEVIQPAT
jgi:hypothetical protein